MDYRKKIQICIITNLLLLLLVAITVTIFSSDESSYWKFGPSEKLIVISVRVDTLTKYLSLLAFLVVVNVSKVIIEQVGMPILEFNVYNPDKKVITEFKKLELNIYANTMYFLTSVRGVFMILVSISQFDIALFNVLVAETTSVFTVRMLLNAKTFRDLTQEMDRDYEAEDEENIELDSKSLVRVL